MAGMRKAGVEISWTRTHVVAVARAFAAGLENQCSPSSSENQAHGCGLAHDTCGRASCAQLHE